MSSASSVSVSEPLWGASTSTPDHPPDANEESLNIGLYVCHMCNKHYARHCDLNKHLKTHNRSFKCPVEGCRYNTFGWPTEKELERHHNDKHSTAPKVFSCWYQPCNYTSKRESNCKQHMEKAHGWQYIRTRAGNRDDGSASNPTEFSPHGDTIMVSDPDAVDLDLHNVPDFMLTPSPLEQHLPAPHDVSLSMAFGGNLQYAPGVYGPWTSPVTPLGNNGPFVGATGQAHALESPRPTPDNELLMVPVDPRLCQSAQDASPTTADVRGLPSAIDRQAMLKTLPTIVTTKSSPVVKSQVLTPTSDLSPALFSAAVSYRGAVRPSDAEYNPTPGSSATQSLSTRSASLRKTDGKRQERRSNDTDEDGHDDDEEPPTKRNKGSGGDQDGKQGDPKLICPFRAEHPDVYNRDLDPRYASCHTEHANISTVIRHLGRPAHKLQVDNSPNGRSTVASFNIADPAYDHPAAGLCRRCWTQFDDPQAFDDHVKAKCVSRSRGKLEKFDLIRGTFCRPRGATATSKGSSDKGKAKEGENINVAPVAQAHRLDTISRLEFDSLVQRVAELEQRLAFERTGSTPRVVPQQARAVARAFSSSPALPSSQAAHPFGLYVYNDGAGPSGAGSGNSLAQQSLGSLSRQVIERGSPTGQYNNNQSNMPSFGMNAPSRSGSASTLRRENAAAMTGRVLATQQRRQFGESNNNNPPRQVETPTYGPTATANPTAVIATGDSRARTGAAIVDSSLQLAGNQTEEGQTSQQSTNTVLRNQWDHAVEMHTDILGRGGGMDIFNTSSDDFSKYLDMGSQ